MTKCSIALKRSLKISMNWKVQLGTIEYYNQKRFKIKLKGLTPIEYRQLVLSKANKVS